MTVAELIERLQRFKPELPVALPGQGQNYGAFEDCSSVKEFIMSKPLSGDWFTDPEIYEDNQVRVVLLNGPDYL